MIPKECIFQSEDKKESTTTDADEQLDVITSFCQRRFYSECNIRIKSIKLTAISSPFTKTSVAE